MTKRDYCKQHGVIAYWSGLGGFEIHGIDYGIDDYMYAVSNAWHTGYGRPTYHRLKVHYGPSGAYVRCYGVRIPLNECVRTNYGPVNC